MGHRFGATQLPIISCMHKVRLVFLKKGTCISTYVDQIKKGSPCLSHDPMPRKKKSLNSSNLLIAYPESKASAFGSCCSFFTAVCAQHIRGTLVKNADA